MTGSPMAIVCDEIFGSATVHFSKEPAGTSCSAEAMEGVAKSTAQRGAESRKEKINLLFIEEPQTCAGSRRSPVAVAPCKRATLTMQAPPAAPSHQGEAHT